MSTLSAIDGHTPLPELFDAHPAARAVFHRYGLRGCGGERGPAETMAFFAATHGVDLDRLIEEVEQTIHDPHTREQARRQLATETAPDIADGIHRPFFLSGLAVILSVGAAWGVWMLAKIGVRGSFTAVGVHEVNAHGHAQIMGWVGLFIMGFAYQAFPRMWHVRLPAPRVALATWLTMLSGIALRCSAMMFSQTNWAPPLHRLGVGLEVIAVTTLILLLGLAFLRSGQSLRPYVVFAFAALGFFWLQTIYSGWHTQRLMAATSQEALLEQIGTYQAPLRDLQIHGMAMLMILAVGLRLFPAIFGFSETPDRRGWLALGILLTAIPLETSMFLAYRTTGHTSFAGVLYLAWALLPIGTALIVVPWRFWRPSPGPGRSDRSEKFIRAALTWMFVSFAMLLFLPVYRIVSDIPFSHAYYGAIRHAITVGFISMMIVGVSAKVVPTLGGVAPEKLPRLALPFVLINLGCLLRVCFQVGTDWHPGFFRVVGASGVLEWTGLAIWAVHLARLLVGSERPDSRPEDPPPAPARIEPESTVAAVLNWFPEVEHVFVDFGFDRIRNPVLRRTVARNVTIRHACRMRGVDVATFLVALDRARDEQPSSAHLGDSNPVRST